MAIGDHDRRALVCDDARRDLGDDKRDLLNDEDWGFWSADGEHDHTFVQITRQGVAVDPLRFAQWMLNIAQGDFGDVRSRGIVAVAGSSTRLSFNAAANLVERVSTSEWPSLRSRYVDIVIFADADGCRRRHREMLTERFESCLLPVASWARDPEANTVRPAPLPLALVESMPCLFYCLVVEHLTTSEALRLACSCTCMAEALLGEEGGDELHRAGKVLLAAPAPAASELVPSPRMLHPKGPAELAKLHVHGLLPLRVAACYAEAFAASGSTIVPEAGLVFADAAEAEAAGVAWLEIVQERRRLHRGSTIGSTSALVAFPRQAAPPYWFVVDFTWRPATIEQFFSGGDGAAGGDGVAGWSTFSALARVEVNDELAFCQDTFKFRMMLYAEARGARTYRLGFQLVGSRSSSQVYTIAFHTIDVARPVHVAVPDFRMAVVKSHETLDEGHPLVTALRHRHRVRTLVRMEPDEDADWTWRTEL